MNGLLDIIRELTLQNGSMLTGLTGGGLGVLAVAVTAGGTGYATPPAVTIAAGPGVQATGVAVLESGSVVRVILTLRGSGYVTAPAVTFDSGVAAATAYLAPLTLDGVKTTTLQPGATMLIPAGTDVSIYGLVAGTDAEASPDVIRPDDYAASTNEKVWKRLNFSAPAIKAGILLLWNQTTSASATMQVSGIGDARSPVFGPEY